MAGTIKGITIEIAGNTQPLNKSLESVNNKTRDLQSELKQVERLLKLDPGNTELLAQKQKLLAGAVENSSDKLKILREAQKQVQQQFERGEIGEEQYRAFQREVVKAEQELKRFEDQLEDVGKKADQLGDRLKSAGDKMKSVGEKMTVGITAPIVAGGALMLKGAMDAEAAQGKLQAALGATAEDAEELGKVAKEIWTEGFGENIEEASAAVVMVKQNLLLAGDALVKFTEGAMTIANVFDQDVNEVIAAAKTMVDNFGISGQEALDIITVGFQQGGDFSGELLDTLREYSPQFASLGINAERAMSILISGAQAGAFNLDKVGDALKEFNIRAQDGSKTTAEGFSMIGLNAAKMAQDIAAGGEKAQQAFVATVTALAAVDDNVKFNQAGVALFGTQWEDLRGDVILAMQDGINYLHDFEGATEKATQAVQNNSPALALTQALRELQTAIGPALLPIAKIINDSVAPALKSMAEGFSNLSPEEQKAILAIAGIVAAIGPLLVGLGYVAGAIAKIGVIIGPVTTAVRILAGGGGIAGLTASFPALGSAITLLTGPIGLAVLGIGGLIAGGVALYKYMQQDAIPEVQLFGDETSKATEKAVGSYMELDDKAGQALMNLKITSETVTQEIASSLTGTFSQMTNMIIQGMEKDFSESTARMQDFLASSNALSQEEEQKILVDMQAGYEMKVATIREGEARCQEIWNTAAKEHRDTTQAEDAEIEHIRQSMKETAVRTLSETELESRAILERMRQQSDELSAQQAAEVVKNSTKQKDKAVKAAEEQYNDVIKEIIRQRDEMGVLTQEQADKAIADAIRMRDELIKKAEETHQGVIDAAKKQAGEHVEQVNWETGEIKSKWEVLRDSVRKKMSELDGFLRNFGVNTGAFFKKLGSDAIGWGQNFVQGMIDGITGFIDRAVAAAGNLADKISAKVRHILGIESPSKVMAEFGRYVAEGLAVGMKGGESDVEKQAQKMASAISNAVSAMTKELSGSLELTKAELDLEKQALSANASETDKLAVDIKKLAAEKENLIQKVEIITAAYETAKTKLGENSETTKQYAQELKLTQIELDKTAISISKTEAAIDSENKKAKEAAKTQAQGLRDLAEQVAAVEKKYREDLAAALEDYESKVAAVNANLAKEEASLTEQYEIQLQARANALSNFVDLFDAVTTKAVTGDQLLSNLEGQVKAFEDWQANLTELGAKGIDEGLLQQLREMGPSAGSEIAALNTLTEDQLSQYVTLWREKQALAKEEAITQLQTQKEEMQIKLQEIRLAAAEQLEAYRAEWEKKNAEIRKNAETELNKISEKFKGIAEAGTKYGISLMANFTAGMASQFDNLRATLEEAASIVDSYMPHSPAKVGPLKRLGEWGPSLVKNFADGIQASIPDLEKAMTNLASKAAPDQASFGGSTGRSYGSVTNNNSGGNNIYITVQDGEDLLRTLQRMGVRIS